MPVLFGVAIVTIAFGGFGTWAAVAPLNSAVIAPGTIMVESMRKTIQHLEGGIIESILVKDGDVVGPAQPLVRLDDTQAKATLDLLLGKYRAARALESRLIAESEGSEAISFPEDLLSSKGASAVQEIVAAQQSIFQARREALGGEIAILTRTIGQIEEQITGFEAQRAAEGKQIQLLREELGAVEQLLAAGYERKPRVLALKRALAELEGQRGEHVALVAEAKQRIGEARLRIMQLRNDEQNRVLQQLRHVQDEVSDLQERVRAARDVLERTVIRAPSKGTVVGMRYHTPGGVIGPGEPILDLVPLDDRLTVQARISPEDIEMVHVGSKAQIQLTAYKRRNTPTIDGRINYVSADQLSDDQGGEPYFLVRVSVDGASLERLEGIKLTPGMPTEVAIEAGERTTLDYVLTPLTTTLRHAFREQ